MTQQEINAWLHRLAHSDAMRLLIIKDLLRHASGDEMSAEDRTVCRECIDILQKRLNATKQRSQDTARSRALPRLGTTEADRLLGYTPRQDTWSNSSQSLEST